MPWFRALRGALLHDSQRLLAVYGLVLYAICAATTTLYLQRLPNPPTILTAMVTLLAPLPELAVFYCLGSLLLATGSLRNNRLRMLLYAANAFVFTLVYVAQCYALAISNAYISVLAVENMEHARFTASTTQYLLLIVGGAVWLVFIGLCWRAEAKQRGSRARTAALVIGLTALAAVGVINLWTSIAGGSSRLQAGQTPFASLLKAGRGYLADGPVSTMSPGQSTYCGTPPGEGQFAFLKNYVNRSALPFSTLRTQNRPNVIVLFFEGTSARLLEAYGGRYPGLTPNIARMARQSLRVDNYFNHTAATFRGLQGQLTSGFPRHGGADAGAGWTEGNAEAYARRSYSTLTGILEDKGYHSVFFSPHKRSDALTRLIDMLGFDEIYTFERSSRELLEQIDPPNRGSLTDRNLFQTLIAYLRKHNDDARSLFVGLYNIGTHAFLDVDRRGVTYGDGDNISLNTLHNLDVQFGRFYDYFMASDYAKDTLLVLTADHAHYPGPPYVEAVAQAQDYSPYFVDRIPLLVHAPWLQLPASFDTHGRTSLDFAPTVLQLLGIEQVRNSFVGHSIFDKRFNRELQLAPIGRSIYAIYHGRVYGPNVVPEEIDSEYASCKNLVEQYYAHEMRNAIFPESSGTGSANAATSQNPMVLN